MVEVFYFSPSTGRLPDCHLSRLLRSAGAAVRVFVNLSHRAIIGLTLPSGSVSKPCVHESSGVEIWGTHPEHEWLTDQPGRPELPTSVRPRAPRPGRAQIPQATRPRLDQEIAAIAAFLIGLGFRQYFLFVMYGLGPIDKPTLRGFPRIALTCRYGPHVA